MSDDEYDYMSDTFLASETNDIRPGLVQSRSLKRNHEISKKKESLDKLNKERFKPLKVLEKEKLHEGMQKPIDAENKGYALLKKMGFRPGFGLGKEGTGSSEPITVDIKTNREGLGAKTALEEKQAEASRKWKEVQLNAPSLKDFRSRIICEDNERQNNIALYKSQKACHYLESAKGITEPEYEWFWPPKALQNDEQSDEDETEEENNLTVEDKLEILTHHLRKKYLYCVWCGTNFDDDNDMKEECPGPFQSDH